MIFVTGDCHSEFQKLLTAAFPEQREMTKDDIVIICGDFGAVWNADGVSNSEAYWLNWLDEKPFNINIGGIIGNIRACVIKNFAVEIDVIAGIFLDSVDDCRPEVARAVRACISGELNVLCGVKAETVNA